MFRRKPAPDLIRGGRRFADENMRQLDDPAALKQALGGQARALGFDALAVTRPDTIPHATDALARFIADGFHGDMDWLAANPARRGDPRTLWRDVRSIVMLGVNYGPGHDPLAILQKRERGAISVLAP